MEPAFSSLPVVILCGGLGTRLGEITKSSPKCLVDINGRPFLYHQLDLLKRSGLSRVVLCVHHYADQVRAAAFAYDGMEISMVYDGFASAGTGGAVLRAFPLLTDDFFVLYGDSCLPIDYRPLFDSHLASGKLATMSTWNGVDFGMNLFQKRAFDGFAGSFDIHRVFESLGDKLNTWPSPSRFYEIGSPEKLAEVRELLK